MNPCYFTRPGVLLHVRDLIEVRVSVSRSPQDGREGTFVQGPPDRDRADRRSFVAAHREGENEHTGNRERTEAREK